MDASWFRNASKEQKGDYGEDLWTNVLIEANYRLVLLHKIEDGGAPLMKGKGSFVLPDFEGHSCSAYRHSILLDSKVKAGPVMFRLKKQWRHGINKSNYQDYLTCGEIMSRPSGIAILECFTDEMTQNEWSGSLLVQSFKNLGAPLPEVMRERPPKVYWPRKSFVQLGRFTPSEIHEIRCGSRVPNYEAKLQYVFAPTKQAVLF
jgi:hypothetical protein